MRSGTAARLRLAWCGWAHTSVPRASGWLDAQLATMSSRRGPTASARGMAAQYAAPAREASVFEWRTMNGTGELTPLDWSGSHPTREQTSRAVLDASRAATSTTRGPTTSDGGMGAAAASSPSPSGTDVLRQSVSSGLSLIPAVMSIGALSASPAVSGGPHRPAAWPTEVAARRVQRPASTERYPQSCTSLHSMIRR